MATADSTETDAELGSAEAVATALGDVMDAQTDAIRALEAFRGSPECTEHSLMGVVDGCLEEAGADRRRLFLVIEELPYELDDETRPECWDEVEEERR